MYGAPGRQASGGWTCHLVSRGGVEKTAGKAIQDRRFVTHLLGLEGAQRRHGMVQSFRLACGPTGKGDKHAFNVYKINELAIYFRLPSCRPSNS